MALPEFNENGLLPEGLHAASDSDLRDRCVTAFVNSVRRPMVFATFVTYQQDVAGVGVNSTQVIDGSFIDQTRMEPDDIDLANFCDAANLNSLSQPAQASITPLLNGREATKAKYNTHTFLVVRFPEGHPFEAKFEEMRKYWLDWFSRPQDYSGPKKIPAPWRGRKGLVRMSVGDSKLCPMIDDTL
jgi:hypothetical protein